MDKLSKRFSDPKSFQDSKLIHEDKSNNIDSSKIKQALSGVKDQDQFKALLIAAMEGGLDVDKSIQFAKDAINKQITSNDLNNARSVDDGLID